MWRRSIVVLLLALLTIAAPTAPGQEAVTSEHQRQVVHKVIPVYPDLAKRTHLSGVVKLQATIAPDGSVKLIKVVGGNPVFIKAAQDAVANWKYTSAPSETHESVELVFDTPH
jgi:TonB family protein